MSMFQTIRRTLAKVIYPEAFKHMLAVERRYSKVMHDLDEVYHWMDKGSEARKVAYYLLRRADWLKHSKIEEPNNEMSFYIVYPEVSRFRELLRESKKGYEDELRDVLREELKEEFEANRGAIMLESYVGIWKVIEEAGELLQQLGKLGAFPSGAHPDGQGNLRDRVVGEAVDLSAALAYFANRNEMKLKGQRYEYKLDRFHEWGLSGIWHHDKA